MDESLFSKELLQCPICLNEIEATVWDVIEADTDPDLKEKLLCKDLQTQQCLNCGQAWIPARPMLYRDNAGKMIIYCRSGQTEEQARAILAKVPVLPGWNLRLVADYNQLIEKIHITDHRCDDRLIEFIKLAVKRQGVEDQDAAIAQLFFLTADDQTFRFLVSSEDGGWYTPRPREPDLPER